MDVISRTMYNKSDLLPLIDPRKNYGISNKFENGNKNEFWITDPSILIEVLDIVPHDNMNDEERLNALTRIILIISLIMYIIKFEGWIIFLFLGIAFTVCIYGTKIK